MSEEIYQLSAKDAFKIAEDFHKKKQDTILSWMLMNIRSCAEMGCHSLRINTDELVDSCTDDEIEAVADELSNLGYDVDYTFKGEFTINWEDANE